MPFFVPPAVIAVPIAAFLVEAGISSAYVVAQDWGTALAFHLAASKSEFVRGLAFVEFIRPMPSSSVLQRLRSRLHPSLVH